ncbi:DUF3048 domain-containing protein [Nonomuraea cavernae]|uniref:DUF3048 domain-containing protein n=1 Tax=Nonomuraea cavernae TaxID=2045107 RepID=A0A918DLI2_9ACTN|nr:DUF3048 domain-containing protein [Nonomuraea cavernae]MCA2188019.1 DUF3048 domain-containing protein [Nonomuraea cavernae]GGO72568.1 hypothetical protein GCM10012289_40870 [Nonomuraea cavernae]
MRLFRMITVTLAGAAVLLPVAACSSDEPAAGQAPEATVTTPAEEETPDAGKTHPFTGKPTQALKPVLAVKIENTAAGKPQMGLKSADIVYVEQVEAGLTRLMAIFSSKLPAKVGPVRSARISDLHIVPQFGKPAFAYSGAQTKMLPFIAEASLFDVSDSRAPGAYFRQPGRYAPYNLFATSKQLLASAPKASKAKDIGFTFGDAPAEGGVDRTSYTVKWPAARFTFAWSEARKQWLIWQDGKKDMAAEGGQLGAPTIVVQYTKTERSQFHDKNQSYTPLVHSVGKGSAIVLRDGKAYKARWERESEEGGTTFTTESGEPMNFAPGQVWVALASRKPVTP